MQPRNPGQMCKIKETTNLTRNADLYAFWNTILFQQKREASQLHSVQIVSTLWTSCVTHTHQLGNLNFFWEEKHGNWKMWKHKNRNMRNRQVNFNVNNDFQAQPMSACSSWLLLPFWTFDPVSVPSFLCYQLLHMHDISLCNWFNDPMYWEVCAVNYFFLRD